MHSTVRDGREYIQGVTTPDGSIDVVYDHDSEEFVLGVDMVGEEERTVKMGIRETQILSDALQTDLSVDDCGKCDAESSVVVKMEEDSPIGHRIERCAECGRWWMDDEVYGPDEWEESGPLAERM